MADIIHHIISPLKQELDHKSLLLLKSEVLNYLIRHICFVDQSDKVRNISNKEMKEIEAKTKLSGDLIFHIIDQFFSNMRFLKTFFTSKKITWEHERTKLMKKVRIYLHKLHKIAPVFSYQRAKENLKILYSLLDLKNHWPHISTQIALVIFITDRNDKTNKSRKYIIQKNLRVLCDCSAYAFHRARNILGINKKGKTY